MWVVGRGLRVGGSNKTNKERKAKAVGCILVASTPTLCGVTHTTKKPYKMCIPSHAWAPDLRGRLCRPPAARAVYGAAFVASASAALQQAGVLPLSENSVIFCAQVRVQ